jgi:hypothetical protein
VFDGNPPIQIPAGAAAGDVLTSDSSGNATWQVPAAAAVTAETIRAEAAEGANAAAISTNAAAIALLAPLASPALTGTPTVPTVAGTADSTTKIASTAFVQAVVTASNTPGAWQAVTLPTGFTGTLRVKQLAEPNFCALDVNLTQTSDSATGTTYTAGSLPSSAYYPAASRQYTLSVNQVFTTSANASPRLTLPASGALSIIMPAFNTAGSACIVSATLVYPTN